MRPAIRELVCNECHRRPPGSEALPPAAPRSCEPRCPLFVHLPRLAALVERFGGEPPCGYQSAVENLICQSCSCDDPEAGSITASHAGRDAAGRPCSLSRYAPVALAVVEHVGVRRGYRPV